MVIPFVLVVVTVRLQRFDIELEQASRDLGAGVTETLRRITLPIVLPAVIGVPTLSALICSGDMYATVPTSVPGRV